MCRKAGNGKCFAYLWQQTADSLVLVWLLGGLLSLIGALCYAELATAYPREGGDHVYLTETLSRRSGFFFAWAQLRVVRPDSIRAMVCSFQNDAPTTRTASEGSGVSPPLLFQHWAGVEPLAALRLHPIARLRWSPTA